VDVVDPRVRRVILPTLATKHLDTVFHTFLSVIHVLFTDADLVLLCNVANSPLAWIPRAFRKPTVLNVDGLDRKRRKWGLLARSFLLLCETTAVVTPTRLVTDARHIQDYYWRRYRKRSTMIAYGAEVPEGSGDLEGFDLPARRYVLYVGRLEPENNPELVIRAYRQVQTDWPLVIVGGNPYDGSYVGRIKALADSRVVFTGAVYGKQYWSLLKNAGLYVYAGEVGGTHPALVEAMAAETSVLYLDTPENGETVGDCGVAFRPNVDDLAAKTLTLIRDSDLRSELGRRARERAQKTYTWEEVTQKYEDVFFEVLGKEPSRDIPTSSSI
jgi:glycosyltransferase involved in cell wall biosynthesis